MTEFLSAAFPWIGMGLAVAIVIAYQDARMKKKMTNNLYGNKTSSGKRGCRHVGG